MGNRTYYSRDAEMRASMDRLGTTILFIALGLAVGAVLALLFAPHRGEETRDDIGRAIEEGLNSGRDSTSSTLHRMEQDFADLRKKVEHRLNEMR